MVAHTPHRTKDGRPPIAAPKTPPPKDRINISKLNIFYSF
jgi:hypothetical protein